MLRRDLGAADPKAFEPAGLDQPAGGITGRVLEGAPQAPLLDRLRRTPVLLHIQQSRPHLGRRVIRGPECRQEDHPSGARTFEAGIAVIKPTLGGGQRMPAALRVNRLDSTQAVLHLATEGPRIADDRAPHAPRHPGGKLQAGPARPGRLRRELRHQVAGRHRDLAAVDREAPVDQLDRQSRKLLGGEERVAGGADHPVRLALGIEPRHQLGQGPIVCELEKKPGPPANPVPAEGGQRLAFPNAGIRGQPGVRQPASAPAPRQFS